MAGEVSLMDTSDILRLSQESSSSDGKVEESSELIASVQTKTTADINDPEGIVEATVGVEKDGVDSQMNSECAENETAPSGSGDSKGNEVTPDDVKNVKDTLACLASEMTAEKLESLPSDDIFNIHKQLSGYLGTVMAALQSKVQSSNVK